MKNRFEMRDAGCEKRPRHWAWAFIVISYLVSGISYRSYADFDDLGMGARAAGMGNAFTGMADDVRAIYYNPAGLGWLARAQMSADYSRLHLGLDDGSSLSLGYLSYAYPIFRSEKARRLMYETLSVSTETAPAVENSTAAVNTLVVEGATVTVAAARTAKPALPPRRVLVPEYGTVGASLRTFSLAGAYRENTFTLSYGHTLGRRLSGGINLKVLQEKYEQDAYTRLDPVFDYGRKNSVQAVSLDAGVLWNWRSRLFWGAALSDLNQPNVGLMASAKLPMTVRTGLGYRDRRTAAAVDFTTRDGQWRIGAGGERWVAKNVLALRTGLEVGQNSLFNMNFGFSANLSIIQLDYAFLFPMSGLEKDGGTHRVSFVYRWGRPQKDEVEPGSLEYSYFELQEEKDDLRLKLEELQEERDRLEKVLLEEATQRIRERISSEKENARRATASRAEGASSARGESGFQTYYTKAGDTLPVLAARLLGSADRWKEIYEGNKDKIGRGGRLKPGTLLVVQGRPAAAPAVEAPREPARPTAPATAEQSGERKILRATPAEAPAAMALPAAAPPVFTPTAHKAAAQSQAGSHAGKTHTVAAGETLKSIAEEYYGNAGKWMDIYKANKDKISRGTVTPGQVLTMP